MPDVHWGKGATVGSVIPTVKALIPAAVGVDIGCGMMVVQTSIRAEHLPSNLHDLRTKIEAAIPYGRLSISEQGLIERDSFVFAQAKSRGIPIAICLSSGYGKQNYLSVSNSIIEATKAMKKRRCDEVIDDMLLYDDKSIKESNMHTTMSIRELTRMGSELSKYDYIDIEDRKAKTYKGLFVSHEYAAQTKEYLENLLKEEQELKKSKILKFAGIMSGETEGKKIQELKEQKS